MAIAYNTSIVRDGLVVYLDAANPKSYPGSGNTWKNLISSNHNITLFNSPTYNPSIGYFSFDGVNQFATQSASSFNSGNGTMYTFEIWFKMRTLPISTYGSNGHIWGGQNGNNIVLYVNPAISGTSKLNMIYDDSRYIDSGHFSNGSILANTWVCWTVVGDGTTNKITHYINGVLDKFEGSVVSGQEIRNWPSSSRIALDSRWGTYSELDIGILKQYNKKLTSTEVMQNFEAAKRRYGI
jgi:hypothetical protein